MSAMQKLIAAYFLALLFACGPALAFIKHGAPAATNPLIPTLVAGTAAPTAQTPSMPSASTWDPSCLDATWGTGCNVSTHTCIAPTVGTPLETCQPPQELFISSANAAASTGNGTTATIHYTSAMSYTYTAATPLLITGAAQANWNTPAIGVTTFTGGAGGCAPTCTVVLGFATLSAAPFTVGQTIYVGNASGTALGSQIAGQGWTNGNPNGQWVVSAVTTSSVTFSTASTQVTGTLGAPGGGLTYNGTIQRPWVVSTSACTGVACTVTFANPNTCASACVSATTQIAAGQNDDTVLNWHYGETMQNSVQNGDVQACAFLKHISDGITGHFVSFALDGGAWVTVTAPIVDPNGTGKSTLPPLPANVYCAHFAASSVTDGLHEIRAIGCTVAGICGTLTSVITADGNTGSTYFTSRGHALQPWKALGVTKSFDSGFQNYNWQYYTGGITLTSGTGAGSGGVSLGFAQPANYPLFQPNQTVNISGSVTNNTCPITGGTSTGGVLTITYSGGCNFPTGSEVSIAGVTVAPVSILSGTYNSGSGIISLTFSSAPNGTAPTTGTNANPYVNEYWINTLTGTAPILSLGSIVAGTGGTPGSYTSVALTGGTGTGATANITINGSGNVTVATINAAGTGYTLNDTLTASPGSVTGFSVNVATNRISALTGSHQLISSSAAGTVLNFQDTTGFGAITFNGGTVAGNGVLSTAPLGWNSSISQGATVSSGGTTSITIPSISTSVWASGGTLTADWDGNCTIPSSYTPTSGSITCPTLNATTTRASGGTITAQGNLYCTVGGAGDWLAPYDPASIGVQIPGQFNPDSFELIASTATTCSSVQNTTGCSLTVCGITPSQPETLWLTRKDSGLDERYPTLSPMAVNGSLWITTNAGGAIQGQNAYVDAWKQTSGGTACLGPVVAAGAPLTAHTSNYCTDTRSAFFGLVPTANGATQTLANASGCLTFTQANNQGAIPFYVGEPVEWTGLDNNTGPQGSYNSPTLSNWGVYWIKSLTGTAPSGTITIAPTPTGACIDDTAANITTSALFQDMGMSGMLFACNTTNNANQVPCSNANPETVEIGSSVSVSAVTTYAKSGYFLLGPDTAAGSTFPATQHQVSLVGGSGTSGFGSIIFGAGISQGGRIHVTADSIETILKLTPAVPITKTPPLTTVTSGSATGTTETLNFAALGSGVAWQVAGTGSPGQGIIVAGMTPSSGNCGTQAVPCHITSATSTSITFTNPAAVTGSYTGFGTIRPDTIILQVAPGTFAYDATLNPNGLCGNGSSVSIPTGAALVCFAAHGTSASADGTNSTAWPWYQIPLGNITTMVQNSNCLSPGSGQSSAAGAVTALNITPGAVSGGNDIVELTWTVSGSFSFQAANDCAGTFNFANVPFSLNGFGTHVATDVWEDTRDVTGPYWQNAFKGNGGMLYFGTVGAYYITNSHRYNTHTASDRATYAWGTNNEYNTGICANAAMVLVYVRCVGGQLATPAALGGGNLTGALPPTFWIPITADVHIGDTSVSVATGTLPPNLAISWLPIVVCNMSEPLTTSSLTITPTNMLVSAYNNATNPATITFTPGTGTPTSACPVGQNPAVVLYNAIHIDAYFFLFNENAPPLITASPWTYINNVLYEDTQCINCVNMQQLFLAGAGHFNNTYDDNMFGAMSMPGNLFTFKSWTPTNPYSNYNILIRNSDLWGLVSVPPDPGSTPATYNDVYVINSSGGNSWINFPVQSQLDLLYGGFAGVTNGMHVPFASGFEQTTIWPTLTKTVDGSGLPTGGGTPWSGSLSACPWVGGILGCAAGDPGNGTM